MRGCYAFRSEWHPKCSLFPRSPAWPVLGWQRWGKEGGFLTLLWSSAGWFDHKAKHWGTLDLCVMPWQPQAGHPQRSFWSLENRDLIVCTPFLQCLEMLKRGCSAPGVLETGGSLQRCRASGVHPVPGTWVLGLQHHCAAFPSPHSITQIALVAPGGGLAAAKPSLQPPSEMKALLVGAALLPWMPCCVGSRAHCASLLLQITSAAETEAVTSQKLVKGHAYSVTGAEEVGALPAPVGCNAVSLTCDLSHGSHKFIFNFANSPVSLVLLNPRVSSS